MPIQAVGSHAGAVAPHPALFDPPVKAADPNALPHWLQIPRKPSPLDLFDPPVKAADPNALPDWLQIPGKSSPLDLFGPPPLTSQLMLSKAVNLSKPGGAGPAAGAASPMAHAGLKPGTVQDPPAGSPFVALRFGAHNGEIKATRTIDSEIRFERNPLWRGQTHRSSETREITIPGKTLPLDIKNLGPGLAAWFPGIKTIFYTSTGKAPVPFAEKPLAGSGMQALSKFGAVATINYEKGVYQAGIGFTEMKDGWGYFVNGRFSTKHVETILNKSTQKPEQDFKVGTLNAGVIFNPHCDKKDGSTLPGTQIQVGQSQLSRLAGGVGFSEPVYARNGALFVTKDMVHLAGWIAGIKQVAAVAGNREVIACDSKGSAQKVANADPSAWVKPVEKGMENAAKAAQVVLSIGGAAAERLIRMALPQIQP